MSNEFDMAPREIIGLIFVGVMITVLWLIFRKLPGLRPDSQPPAAPPPALEAKAPVPPVKE